MTCLTHCIFNLQQDAIVAVCSSLVRNGNGTIYSKMQSSLSAHRHRYSCPRWELHHLQQDVIVAVCSSPSLQLYENGSSILAFVSRVQLAANTLPVFKDVIQAQLPIAVCIVDIGYKHQLRSCNAAANNTPAVCMPCNVMLPRYIGGNVKCKDIWIPRMRS